MYNSFERVIIMPNIKPISDLRNYTEVLKEVDTTNRVYLTRNGYGEYGMGETSLDVDDFTGYDTIQVTVFHESIHDEAAKARVYMTK